MFGKEQTIKCDKEKILGRIVLRKYKDLMEWLRSECGTNEEGKETGVRCSSFFTNGKYSQDSTGIRQFFDDDQVHRTGLTNQFKLVADGSCKKKLTLQEAVCVSLDLKRQRDQGINTTFLLDRLYDEHNMYPQERLLISALNIIPIDRITYTDTLDDSDLLAFKDMFGPDLIDTGKKLEFTQAYKGMFGDFLDTQLNFTPSEKARLSSLTANERLQDKFAKYNIKPSDIRRAYGRLALLAFFVVALILLLAIVLWFVNK